MEYYKSGGTVYAYDTETGFLLAFSDGNWGLCGFNIFTLTHEPETQQITSGEAVLLTSGDPRIAVKKLIDDISF